MTVTEKNPTTAAIRAKSAEMRSAANAADALINDGHNATAAAIVNICRFAATDLIQMLNDEVPHE